MICLSGQDDRAAARRAIRQAIVAELAVLAGLPAARIAVGGEPGQAPYALLDGDTGTRRVSLAISHDGELSVAAVRFDRPVGIDVMRIVDFPDCEDVARDYLGPDVAAVIARLAPGPRADAFARAWSGREARLKCLGWQLAEWSPGLERELARCRAWPLALQEGYVGALALPPKHPCA